MQKMLSKLEASRKELLDLGLRNPLLNYRPSATRGVHVVQESPASVYDILVQQNKSMTFKAAPKKVDGTASELSTENYSDTRLQTAEEEQKLQQRLLNTYYTARTSIEEQGVNILFLAIGMLHWYESDASEEARKAPLILIPVLLERSTARERFQLRYTGEEIGENLSLQAKLKAEFNILLPDLPETDVLAISDYFDTVEKSITPYDKWVLDRQSIVLGFFSFGKFLIYNDLDNEAWPEGGQPVHHSILQSLFDTGFSDPPPTVSEDAFLDDESNADELYQVVDADSSQLLAMLAVHEGRNLVIQGPPGTGKSQTITNIIANAIGHGKKVLFVAEKLAALEVVKRRLDAINLGEACLELHSHKGSKKELHAELKRVLELGKPALQHLEQQVSMLSRQRNELNAYSKAVNTEIGSSGLTPHQVMGFLLQLQNQVKEEPLPRIHIPQSEQWSGARAAEAIALSNRIQALLKNIGMPAHLLFWGSKRTSLMPHDAEAIKLKLSESIQAVISLQQVTDAIAIELHLPPPSHRDATLRMSMIVELAAAQPNLEAVQFADSRWLSHQKEIKTFLAQRRELEDLHQQYDQLFLPEAWSADILPLRAEIVAHGEKWYRFLISDYNKAIKTLKAYCRQPLPKGYAQKLVLLDALMQAKRLQNNLTENKTWLESLFGYRWQQAETAELDAIASFLATLHQGIADNNIPKSFFHYLGQNKDPNKASQYQQQLLQLLQQQGNMLQSVVAVLELDESLLYKGSTLLHQPFEQQHQQLHQWLEGLEQIHQVIAWNNMYQAAEEQQLQPIADAVINWANAKDHLTNALQKEWWESLLQRAYEERPALRRFEKKSHEELADHFAKLDVLNLQYNRARAALRHYAGMPKGEGGGQLNLLKTEFNKKARHMPIRRLMKEAGLAIQTIKPVFMMSPLSIANFLPPGMLHFDLVVFDEASQVRPVEALGALLRGKQLVVVGDTKQLPPTSFFDTMTVEIEDEENVTADLPSILNLCDSQGAPQRMLRWHYRSRHQSLIMLSNHHFYENKLVVFPSPGLGHKKGLFFHHLKETAYDRGGTRTNVQEAEAVASAVMEHAKLHPKLSLGVVAFSTAQRQAIQDALEKKRKENLALESFFATTQPEPFFVKNLENVQGDERDVILISIGYGRTAEGYLSMNFGPLNNDGGEKRLNVLITRARLRCEVFTNITADDIDSARTNSAGVNALKSFLQYAQHGRLDVPVVSGKQADSPFEEAVAKRLQLLGYQVQRQVGSKGFYIDLAVEDPEHPGSFVLGIECDGAAYHSARSARDRDRLRQQVLEANGWTLYRIWSTDWFRNPEREMKHLIAAIDDAWKKRLQEDVDDEEAVVETSIMREAPVAQHTLPHYEIALLPTEMQLQEMHLQPVSKLAQWVTLVVRTEGPVHFDEMARRMVEGAGITRVGPRIREHLKLAARFAEGAGHIKQKGEFLWHSSMEQPVARDRSELPPVSRKLKYIAPEEIIVVIQYVVQNAVAIHPEAAFPLVAKLLGFSRVTEEMRQEILSHIDTAIQSQLIKEENGLLLPFKIKM